MGLKKTIINVVAFLVITAFVNSGLVSAETIDEKIQSKNEQIDSIVKDQETGEKYLAELELKIISLKDEYQGVLKEKNSAEEQLNKLLKDINSLEDKIEQRSEAIRQLARNIQINNDDNSTISMLINSESITDMINTGLGMSKLIKANNERMQAQIDDKMELENLQKQVDKKIKVAETRAVQLEKKELILAEAKLSQMVKINEIAATLATEKKEKENFENQKKEAELKKQQELKLLEEEKSREKEATKILEKQEKKLEQEILKNKDKKIEEGSNQAEPNQKETEISSLHNQNLNDSMSAQSSNSDLSEKPIILPEPEEQPKTNNSVWGAPLSTIIVTSLYGSRSDPTGFSGSFHDGIDLGGTSSTPILSSRAGTVVQSSFDVSAGNYVIIDHGDGYFSYYLHMSVLSVSVGQLVSLGQTIGIMGTTGNSTGVHLHFGIATSQNWTGFTDPSPFLSI